MRYAKLFALIIAVLAAFLAIVSVVSADQPETVALCNPGGHEVNVPVQAVNDKLEHGWTYPPCVPNDGDEDDDDDDNDVDDPIYGCMDETALNYDASATQDDGSCVYEEDNDDEDDECPVDADVCPPDDGGDDDDNPGDDGDTPRGNLPTTSSAPEPQECVDVNAPFLQQDGALLLSAESFLVQPTPAWAFEATEIGWEVELDTISPPDMAREGNWGSILCYNYGGPRGLQVVSAHFNGELAGLTLVQVNSDSIYIVDAVILNPALVKQDPLSFVWYD